MGHKIEVTKEKATKYRKDAGGQVWSDSPPIVKGYYWFRYKVKKKEKWSASLIVSVCKENNVWVFYLTRDWVNYSSGNNWDYTVGTYKWEQWAGPLVEPKEV